MPRGICKCFSQKSSKHNGISPIHTEQQNIQCESWQKLLDIIESASQNGLEEFAPLREFTLEERADIITLPSTIVKLKTVKKLILYGSYLVRIPPEIGEMESLEEFVPYTSHLLHWFPYEITRCRKLISSRVSTRSLYGNWKYRPPFPFFNSENEDDYLEVTPHNCSVCHADLDRSKVYRRWISLPVATDVLPLLVHACSIDCINSLPQTPNGYVSGAHTGGYHIKQPPAGDC
jgi:hypothetical protein